MEKSMEHEKDIYAKLVHIDSAYWLKTMEHYPETVEEFKLLISIFDKTEIFKKFDLDQIINMNGDKLNILYATLRILNKMFNKYLDHVVKKIFKIRLEEIFICNHLTYYDLFFDQIVQDIDSFICSQIYLLWDDFPSDIPKCKIILEKLIDYLTRTFQKDFYQDIGKKLEYQLDHDYLNKNMEILSTIVEDYIVYTKETLAETYLIMSLFLEKIFGQHCDENIIKEIISALDKHFNLDELLNEQCTEIQIYYEYI